MYFSISFFLHIFSQIFLYQIFLFLNTYIKRILINENIKYKFVTIPWQCDNARTLCHITSGTLAKTEEK